ncbi:hypothetical protein C8R47DRAFT_1229820 [Mycena vitilis]|nr:hypothetical protein C8R47DRAFT_1229820 [Mycena vitilis]
MEVVDRNTKRDTDRAEKAKEIFAQTTAIASVEELDAAFQISRGGAGYLTVADLDLQLDWHIANAIPSEESSASGIPMAKTGANGRGGRDTRYTYLREAIARRNVLLQRSAASADSAIEAIPPERPISSRMEVDDDGADSEEEYHRG